VPDSVEGPLYVQKRRRGCTPLGWRDGWSLYGIRILGLWWIVGSETQTVPGGEDCLVQVRV
jgi:hypothetical protein